MKNIIALLTVFCCTLPVFGETILLEAEGFADRGGWIVDQQSMDRMGSPYLIAHGLGKPVADAATSVEFAKPGDYHVYVRTRKWVAPWVGEQEDTQSPGRFQLLVGGTTLETVFGTRRNDWHWQDGGSVRIAEAGCVELKLRDLTGFNGRCDAIVFTDDPDCVLKDDACEFDPLRRKLLGLTDDPLNAPVAKEGPFDLVVCGGGVAGIASAVSAARSGIKVALVQDRPVLGGNASSEICVPIMGRSNYSEYPNLGNLVHEIDPHPSVASDKAKLAIVRKEPRITLFLSTRIFALEKKDRRITAVIGRNIETNREIRLEGSLFADCTGDGSIGVLAGNEWRMGRESRVQTGERLAPEEADNLTMGASVQWTTRKTGHSTVFPELPWAIRFTPKTIRRAVVGGWDWESGFEQDQIDEIERIRDQGLRAAFGHWDYMKNVEKDPEWRQRVDELELAWAACIIGKRESRRLIGDHVLCEQDILEQKKYPDAFVPFVWHIDLHYPHPENSKYFPGEEFRAAAIEKKIRAYAVPYRCLYAKDVDNLFVAGRCISVTHIALGAVRVQRTTGMMGEVVGMAASLCIRYGVDPRGVYEKYLDELKALVRKGIAPKPERFPPGSEPIPLSERGQTDLIESKR